MTGILINSRTKKGLKDRVLMIHRKAQHKLVVRKSKKNEEHNEIYKETCRIKKSTKIHQKKQSSIGLFVRKTNNKLLTWKRMNQPFFFFDYLTLYKKAKNSHTFSTVKIINRNTGQIFRFTNIQSCQHDKKYTAGFRQNLAGQSLTL